MWMEIGSLSLPLARPHEMATYVASAPWAEYVAAQRSELHTPALPYGVDRAMMEEFWARAPGSAVDHRHRPPVVVLSSFIVGSGNVQKGSGFGNPKRTAQELYSNVDKFVRRSPGLCTSNTSLHVVHDVATRDVVTTRDGVTYHRTRWRSDSVASDRRWVLYPKVLRQIGPWDCAWTVDLTDVFVLRLPACNTLQPERLYIAAGTPPTGRSTAFYAPPPELTLHLGLCT